MSKPDGFSIQGNQKVLCTEFNVIQTLLQFVLLKYYSQKYYLLILIFYSNGTDKKLERIQMGMVSETGMLCHLSLPKSISNMVSWEGTVESLRILLEHLNMISKWDLKQCPWRKLMLTLLAAVKQENVDRKPPFIFFLFPGAPYANLPDFLKFPACLIILKAWEHFSGQRSRTAGAPFCSLPWPVAGTEVAADSLLPLLRTRVGPHRPENQLVVVERKE